LKQTKAKPPLHFIKPDYKPAIRKLAKFVYPFYKNFTTNVRDVNIENIELLAKYYKLLDEKKARLLIAFRHPNADDPMVLVTVFWSQLKKFFKKNKVKLNNPVHFHFVWDRGIPLWAGEEVGWLYSKLGGIPIHRGKVDWNGLNSIRELYAKSNYPILIAPEGATNGHNETLSPLEPGLAQIAAWCYHDLQKANDTKDIYIMPMRIHYKYKKADWTLLRNELEKMKKQIGSQYKVNLIQFDDTQMDAIQKETYAKLLNLYESVLFMLENYFRTYFSISDSKKEFDSLKERIEYLANIVLSHSESFFKIKAKGSIIDRCRKLEQASWDLIYREDIDLKNSSEVELGLLNRIASEAKHHDWNMRLIESFVAIHDEYIPSKPSFERFSDMTLLLYDTITKIIYGSGQKRPRLGELDAFVEFKEPIHINEYSNFFDNGRIETKKALDEITTRLTDSLS
jgi:1-acyl-sn-glycerol-3-phosphate acyltransferase